LPTLLGLSIAELEKKEMETDELVDRIMRKVNFEDLDKTFQYTLGTGTNRVVITRNVGEMLWHLIEEELQHRGELNALLWQDNIDPPITSWFKWKKEALERK
jgi:uncharacterized damage-inducible protein DinB